MTTQAPPNRATLDHTQHPKWERCAVSLSGVWRRLSALRPYALSARAVPAVDHG